jgi:hypothetical protein
MVLSGSNGITFPDSTDQGTGYANGIGFRNRIINGDMGIDQRNAGAAVTATASGVYFGVDRFRIGIGATNAFSLSIQQVSDAPANSGFTYSQKYTVNTATTFAAGDTFQTGQRIEYSNCSDLGWNDATSRYYVTTYTINSANTWEYKTITVASPVAGGKNATLSFWVKSSLTGTFAISFITTGSPALNGIGIYVLFDLGQGATFQTGTTNTWTTSVVISTTTSVRLLANAGATLNITGVQLEVGSVATPFERRPYGTELNLCLRYFRKTLGTANTEPSLYAWGNNSQVIGQSWVYPTQMRASPTVTTEGTLAVENATFTGIISNATSYLLYVTASSGTAGPITFHPNNSYKISFSSEL